MDMENQKREWWEKPGIGIQYQIEYRPGWQWDRDYEAFNESMMDKDGNLKFNGPFCKIESWIALSQKVHVDYHSFESKWHDGICYFNTNLTNWKTPEDYCKKFAIESKKAGIPFMFYYSSIFDHNPQFDSIQPNRHATPSYIGLRDKPTYIDYILSQYEEIMEQYNPDGMWLDWFNWAEKEKTCRATIEYFRKNYPNTIIVFNLSNISPASFDIIDYTVGEAHTLDGQLIGMRQEQSGPDPVFGSTWKWANKYRKKFTHPWEFVSPAGKWWQDFTLRDDIYDLLRMAAITMACGGKFNIGVTSQLNGTIYPEQVKQLELLGEWYNLRKNLFIEALPLTYKRDAPENIIINKSKFNLILSKYQEGFLLHIINMEGKRDPISIGFQKDLMKEIAAIFLEPEHRTLKLKQTESEIKIKIDSNDINLVDTILYLQPK